LRAVMSVLLSARSRVFKRSATRGR
jgi:hypothetical protein